MNDEFDLEAELDFDEAFEKDLLGADDDYDDDLAEFDEFDDHLGSVAVRTAVMQKGDMIALLCIKTATAGAAICRVDPREERPAVQIYDDASAAVEWFTKSLRTSRRNGWNVVYDGLPLQG